MIHPCFLRGNNYSHHQPKGRTNITYIEDESGKV